MKNNLISKTGLMLKKNSSAILLGMGIASFFSAIITTATQTQKAVKLIEQKEEEKGEKLTKKEVVKHTWKLYLIPIILASVGTGTIIGSKYIDGKKIALISTACTTAQNALTEFQTKTKEIVGKDKVKEIADSIAKDKVQNISKEDGDVIHTGYGDTLCFDNQCGRKFTCDPDKIKKAINDINYRLLNEMCVTLNEFYYEIGLSGTVLGEQVGWAMEKGQIVPRFTATLTEKDEPCFVVDFETQPIFNYDYIT